MEVRDDHGPLARVRWQWSRVRECEATGVHFLSWLVLDRDALIVMVGLVDTVGC